MSDNLRQYRAIRAALTQGYPGELTGRMARHMATLAALISGIVASKSTQLPKVAAHVPTGAQPESRVKRFTRWLRNDQVTATGYFIPYAEVLLTHVALQTLVLVMDGSVVGRGGVALMIHVVYKGRALPLAWLVRQGKKGHCLQPPYRRGRAGARTAPAGGIGGVAGRWRVRWDHTPAHCARVWLGLRGPDGQSHHRPVGRSAFPVCDRGSLYQAGDARRTARCAHDGSRVWPSDVPLLLGQGV